jgi:hypothetical protein
MPRSLKFKNPFYALLVIVGVVFALTATAYCVMAFREARPPAVIADAGIPTAPHPLVAWMHQNGEVALMIELGFLAVFVVGAIATDNYWQKRAANQR